MKKITYEDDIPWRLYPITDGMRMSVMLRSYIKAMGLCAGDTFDFNEYLAWIGERRELFCKIKGIALKDNMLPTRETQEQWEKWLWETAGVKI